MKGITTEDARRDFKRHAWLLLLAAGIIGSFIIRWRFVHYNLPAASHIDERRGLDVLLRFHGGTLDPHFFYYPTFLYYMIFAIGGMLGGPEHYLPVGRGLNLLFTCGTGLATYWLGRLLMNSRSAGVLAALLFVWNAIVADSASTATTDALVALLVTVSLAFYLRHARAGSTSDWLFAMIFAGLATSAKYNAFILVAVLVLADILRNTASEDGKEWIDRRLPASLLRFAFVIIGAALVLFATAVPMKFFIPLLRSGAELNSVVDASDLVFIRSRLKLIAVGGAFLAVIGLFAFVRPRLLDRLRPVRVYVGPLIAFAAFAITSPYALISFNKFIYDFGSQLKVLAIGGDEKQWLAYPQFYLDAFGWIVVAFTVAGLAVAWRKLRHDLMIAPVVLLAVYYVIIGAAVRGFPRYLMPVLPVLLLLAAWGFVQCCRWTWQKQRYAAAVVALVVITISALKVSGELREVLARADQTDEMHASLLYATQLHPDYVYFAGFIPDGELRMAGQSIREVREADLQKDGIAAPDSKHSAILMIDSRVRGFARLDGLQLLWQDARGVGQYVYKMLPARP